MERNDVYLPTKQGQDNNWLCQILFSILSRNLWTTRLQVKSIKATHYIHETMHRPKKRVGQTTSAIHQLKKKLLSQCQSINPMHLELHICLKNIADQVEATENLYMECMTPTYKSWLS